MSNVQTTQSPAVLVAIDIAKLRHDVLIEASGWKRRKRLVLLNTAVEFRRLADYLHSLQMPVHIVFEATGNYHRPLAHFLLSQGFHLELIPSLAVARTREAMHNSWDKNDPKDAQVLLHLLRTGVTQRYHDPLVNHTHDFQELSLTYAQISMEKTRMQHRLLTHYLPLYFPEIERHYHASRSLWLLDFLQVFPTPATITALDREQFVQQAWPIIGRKVAKRRLLEDIYDRAQGSIGLPVGEDSEAVAMFRVLLKEMSHLCKLRQQLEQRADIYLGDNDDFRRLKQIPGIGPILALTILAEAGDLRRFGHHRQFLKFCGLGLATQQSGQFRGVTKLSKYGNARLRCALWMAATIAVKQRENSFREKFERYIRKDPLSADRKRMAYVAVTGKMARVVYGIIKSGTERRCSGTRRSTITSARAPITLADVHRRSARIRCDRLRTMGERPNPLPI